MQSQRTHQHFEQRANDVTGLSSARDRLNGRHAEKIADAVLQPPDLCSRTCTVCFHAKSLSDNAQCTPVAQLAYELLRGDEKGVLVKSAVYERHWMSTHDINDKFTAESR